MYVPDADVKPVLATPVKVTVCPFSSICSFRLVPLAVPINAAVLAQGVPFKVRVPLTELPDWVSFPVAVPGTPKTDDVAVTVHLPLMFDCDELPPPQALSRQSIAIQIRRGVFTSTWIREPGYGGQTLVAGSQTPKITVLL